MTVRYPEVLIGGEPICVGEHGEFAWKDDLGVTAQEQTWALDPALAAKILKQEQVSISFDDPGGDKQTWKGVKVVREVPSDSPLQRFVVLTDQRWYLARTYISRSFNLRARSGATKIINIAGAPIEVNPISETIAFAPSSLKGGISPYTADDILQVVQDEIARQWQGPTPVVFRRLGRSRGNYVPPDLILDAPGNVALAQALGAAGGLDLRVAPDGALELVDANMGAEKDTIEKHATYCLEDRGGPMRWIRMTRIAPKNINIFVNRECEVRADFWEREPGTPAFTDAELGDRPILLNKIKVTDLTIPSQGTQIVAGTYLEVDAWFDAINALGDGPPGVALPFNRKSALANYLGPMIEHTFAVDAAGDPVPIWQARTAQLRSDLRITYGLNPRFARLIVPGTIKAVRAALIDPVNGTRQPSGYWGDYCRRPTTQGMQNTRFRAWNTSSVLPVESEPIPITKTYAESWPDQPFTLASAIQAPFTIQVLDNVTGLFRLEPRKDPWGNVADVIQCLVFDVPAINLTDIGTKGLNAFWEDAQLIQTHRGAFVFSATPAAAPIHTYRVSAADALKKLGVSANAVQPEAADYPIRVGPGLITARFGGTTTTATVSSRCSRTRAKPRQSLRR
jgi:hypothetical protein